MDIVERLNELILPVLDEMNVELVELSFRGGRNNRLLRLFVDTESGITVEECRRVSQAVSDILDTEDIIPDRYRLEVSSPGVDRPLTTERDFLRNLGREVSFQVGSDEENRKVQGIIKTVQDEKVTIQVKQKQEEIPIQSIQNAKVVLKW